MYMMINENITKFSVSGVKYLDVFIENYYR